MTTLISVLAAALTDVPAGTDRDEVHAWLHGLEPGRVGWLDVATVESHLSEFSWRRIIRTSRFWDDRPADLADAMTRLAGSLWHLSAPFGLRANGGPGGLTVDLGSPAAHSATLGRLITTFLCGSSERPVVAGPRPAVAGNYVATLWGPPPTDGTSGEESVIGRLARLSGTSWTLSSMLVPAPVNNLEERCARLGTLAAVLAGEVHRQVTVDDLTTASRDDPEASRLSVGVSAERDRTERALHSGAWTAVSWLTAPSLADLHAALGAATALQDPRDPGEASNTASSPGQPSTRRGWRGLTTAAGPTLASPALLTSSEAGELIRPPQVDCLGLPSRRWFPLDRHPEPAIGSGAAVMLGTTEDGASLELPVGALTAHLLLTGSPGSGKTSAIANILVQLHRLGIPFLVVEPIKDEYRALPVPRLMRWAPGSTTPGVDWALNPLEVPLGISVQSHLERLVTLFRASFDMVAPLPHLLELGLQRTYERRGWDLAEDRPPSGSPTWPTITELIEVCQSLPAELGYGPEIRANLQAAVAARAPAPSPADPRAEFSTAMCPSPSPRRWERPLWSISTTSATITCARFSWA